MLQTLLKLREPRREKKKGKEKESEPLNLMKTLFSLKRKRIIRGEVDGLMNILSCDNDVCVEMAWDPILETEH